MSTHYSTYTTTIHPLGHFELPDRKLNHLPMSRATKAASAGKLVERRTPENKGFHDIKAVIAWIDRNVPKSTVMTNARVSINGDGVVGRWYENV